MQKGPGYKQQLVMAEGATAATEGGETGDAAASEPSAGEMVALLREDERDWDEK